MKIPIIYEDNHLLVVDKPANIPVQEDSSGDIDLLTLLKKDIKVRYQKPGNVFLGLVHRLDRPVGGVMVLAKTSKAASRLSDAIRRKKFGRDYLAIVRGVPDKSQGMLEHHLFKDTKKNKVHAVSADHVHAKKAMLAYKVTNNTRQLSLLSIRLHTGRSHQIRVQLSTVGVPLYGDQKYGQPVNRPGQQIALKAHTLSFPHPTTKEIMRFESKPPKEYPWDLFEFK
ncbi:23S rRNA pseudouridine1911/1915/1917 synthase [Virgibacillus halotolerans]|uniref:RluA family pseudouridine synthase n=1 Tax=Virgibacillus halotolerans TaxID=1071053 RepID=UPI001960C25A|nr:RluA family pseudouridine synthase [Virgibacillus halotolerans]MBM7600603.1 23S rRNA pseudouridine1911/1915/1917 synthase [Virgibacillus halotolerans]